MIQITNNSLVGHIAMWLYKLAPKHQPRKADVIMKHVNSRIDSVFDIPIKHDTEFKIRGFEDRNDLYKFVDELMKNIKEFRELNLTWQEYEAGIDVDSPDREEDIVFTSMYDVRSSEDWYTKDFIDLDAFVQDVVYSLLLEDKSERYAEGYTDVKHGKWEQGKCTNCEKRLEDLFEGDFYYDCEELHYCPNCGARMDGEVE